jgi:sugar transferase (PEP-CTERM/EpsH1 system associated)
LRGEPLTVGMYRDRVLQAWVDRLLAARKVDLVLCYSSGVAPLVMGHDRLRRVMDFVDVDSDKWQQYAQQARGGLKRWVYRREARCLAQFERTVATRFDASVLVSEAEAAFFRDLVPESADKVHGIPNGVDAAYWDPSLACPSPYQSGERAVVFVGAMDYRANVDAARWFAHDVWPRIAARRQDARFYIVGSHPTAAVRALAQLAGITVTGRVEDVRPYLAHAHVVTAPLRIARGVQNKVLEALAMGKVLLATPEAYEGVEDFAGRLGCIDSSPAVMATEALRWLEPAQPVHVPAARAHVLSRYDWSASLDAYDRVLTGAQCDAQTAAAAAGVEACS